MRGWQDVLHVAHLIQFHPFTRSNLSSHWCIQCKFLIPFYHSKFSLPGLTPAPDLSRSFQDNYFGSSGRLGCLKSQLDVFKYLAYRRQQFLKNIWFFFHFFTIITIKKVTITFKKKCLDRQCSKVPFLIIIY